MFHSFHRLMDSINWSACHCMGLHSSDGRALQRERRGHGFKSRCFSTAMITSSFCIIVTARGVIIGFLGMIAKLSDICFSCLVKFSSSFSHSPLKIILKKLFTSGSVNIAEYLPRRSRGIIVK